MSATAAVAADLPGIVSLEQWFPERERWSRQLWADELGAPDRLVLVTREASELVAAATFQAVADTVDLHRVVVAGPHRRRGHARALVTQGLAWAEEQQAARMVLEVRHDNAAAVAFYRSLGFVGIGERRDYYAPGAHALVMELEVGR